MSVLERVREQEATGMSVGLGLAVCDCPERPAVTRGGQGLKERLKRELVGRLGLQTVARVASSRDVVRARGELAVTCQAILHSDEFDVLSHHEGELLVEQALDDICGLGPIQSLLDDETVTEVMINGCGGLFYERDGQVKSTQVPFESSEQILMVIDRILAPLGRRLDRANPIVNARLANGDRVNAVAEPIAIDGPSVTIRKFSKRLITLEELVGLGSLPAWYATVLSWAVRMRKDMAVAGGTGSGKTTLLNALSCEIPVDERIVTIEDSAELRFERHPNVVRLEARDASIEGSGEVTIRDLVKNALRMRPDRIVVGECRGEEAIDMLQAMNTGHDGSLTTLHAGTEHEAVLRLVLMARYGMDLPTSIIEEQIATALSFIVMSCRLPGGARRITSMSAVRRAETGGVELVPCVTYDQASGTWRLESEPPFIEEGIREGRLEREEVAAWRMACSSPARR